uniref:Uncharacterized protein n=1 Tax=Romanomermis culicivorax TaxID=13658 RepID=A0A915I010_ROMCU
MLTGLTSWIFGVDSASAENSLEIKGDKEKCLEEPELVERHCSAAQRGRRRSALCKNIGNSWHGDYPSHLHHYQNWNHEQKRTRNQVSKHGRTSGSSKASAANGCKEKDQKKGLNDEGWVWVCDEIQQSGERANAHTIEEMEPTAEAFEHNYAWYAMDDQIDLNTISIHNEWQIAPPSCFTGTPIPEEKRLTCNFDRCEKDFDLPIGEVSMFENLLIEHPSMSIYDKFPERAISLQRITDAKEAKSHRNINEPAIDQSPKLKSLENSAFGDDHSIGSPPDRLGRSPTPLIRHHRRRHSRSALKNLLNYIDDDDPYHSASDNNEEKCRVAEDVSISQNPCHAYQLCLSCDENYLSGLKRTYNSAINFENRANMGAGCYICLSNEYSVNFCLA